MRTATRDPLRGRTAQVATLSADVAAERIEVLLARSAALTPASPAEDLAALLAGRHVRRAARTPRG